MTMKNYFFLLIIAILTFSCKEKEDPNERFDYKFYPRKVSFLKVDLGKQDKTQYPDGRYFTGYFSLEKDTVSNNEWGILIDTDNCNQDTLLYGALYYTILDPPVPEVEKLIEQDYKQASFTPIVGYTKINGKSSQWIGVEYRTSPIRNFKVYSLNTPLFGKSAGESLNDFFTIQGGFYPGIISTPGYNLAYGYGSAESISIKEWLNLHPLAPVKMALAPKTSITAGLPLNVQIVVEMETGEGLVLRDTTRMLTITE